MKMSARNRVKLVWSCLWILVWVNLSPAGADHHLNVTCVKADATGANDGSSWIDAFADLQDALATAMPGHEIWVAAGRYTPGQSDRSATFRLKSGVGIYGGFAGVEEQRNQRDPVVNKTILSGDLKGNDPEVASPLELRAHPLRSDNARHVVTGSGADETAALDGFTISGGHAIGSAEEGNGGGMINVWKAGGGSGRTGPASETPAHAIVANCTFEWNLARENGGGLYNHAGNLTLINCTFQHNDAFGRSDSNSSDWPYGGGGMYTENADPMLADCTFKHNTGSRAAGLYNQAGSPTLHRCVFHANLVPITGSRAYGGGVFNNAGQSEPLFLQCIFTSNESRIGGGFYNQSGATPTLMNCLFRGNSALRVKGAGDGGRGGAIQNWDSFAQLINCTLTENIADGSAAGIGAWGGSRPTVANCILWDNRIETSTVSSNSRTAQIDGANPTTVNYSCVQGGWNSGRGNKGQDPVFVDPHSGDFRLKSQAGHWDAASESWVIDDVTSPCIDGGDPLGPVGLEPFPSGGLVNMGAYGGTAQASKAYFGTEPCDAVLAGDINGDCQVDRLDLIIMSLHWTAEEPLPLN